MPTFVPNESISDVLYEITILSDPLRIPQHLREWGFTPTDFALVTRKTLQDVILYLKGQGFQIRPTDRRHSLINVLTKWLEDEWQKEGQEQARQAHQTQVQAQARAQDQARQTRQAYQAQAQALVQAQAQIRALQAQVQELQARRTHTEEPTYGGAYGEAYREGVDNKEQRESWW